MITWNDHTDGNFFAAAPTIDAFIEIASRMENWGDMSAGKRQAIRKILEVVAKIGHGDFKLADHWKAFAELGDLGFSADNIAEVFKRLEAQNQRDEKPSDDIPRDDKKAAEMPKAGALTIVKDAFDVMMEKVS